VLWNDASFVAAYEKRLAADTPRLVRRAADACEALRGLDTASPLAAALPAMRLLAASLGDHVESSLLSFEHACASRRVTPRRRDLALLGARVSRELVTRRARAARAGRGMLAGRLDPEVTRTLVEQSHAHAARRLAAYVTDPDGNGRPKRMFIGHAAEDARLAELLKEAIVACVGEDVEVFVSSDLDSIKAGEDWLERIIDRLRHCRVVLALVTPHATESAWVHYEVGLADAGDPLVIPVTGRGGRLSELPAPLGRRHGRNLAKLDDLLVLLTEAAAALGVSEQEQPPFLLDELLREARRPVLGSELSATAVRVAEILSERSENAAEWDPSLDAEALRAELGVSPVVFLGAIAELQELGWLLTREGDTTLGLSSIGPAEEFFIDSEAALGEADPRRDAAHIAEIVARKPRDAARVTRIARELGWTPRRMNAALHVLHAAAPDALVSLGARGPLAYVLILPDRGVLRWAQRPWR
jgi:hypothetical protein